jgi:hypothetical protein
LQGHIFSHDPKASDNVIIGRTHQGLLVEVNRYVAFADLIIGVGECMPHPVQDSEEGLRLSARRVLLSPVASHHFTWMRHRSSRVNRLEGNSFFEEIRRGTLSRCRSNSISSSTIRKSHQSLCGDPVAEHREASNYAASFIWSLFKTCRYYDHIGFSLKWGPGDEGFDHGGLLHRSGGAIVWVAPQKEAGSILPFGQGDGK